VVLTTSTLRPPPTVTAFDGYKSVELVDAVYESVKLGQPVKVDSKIRR